MRVRDLRHKASLVMAICSRPPQTGFLGAAAAHSTQPRTSRRAVGDIPADCGPSGIGLAGAGIACRWPEVARLAQRVPG